MILVREVKVQILTSNGYKILLLVEMNHESNLNSAIVVNYNSSVTE